MADALYNLRQVRHVGEKYGWFRRAITPQTNTDGHRSVRAPTTPLAKWVEQGQQGAVPVV